MVVREFEVWVAAGAVEAEGDAYCSRSVLLGPSNTLTFHFFSHGFSSVKNLHLLGDPADAKGHLSMNPYGSVVDSFFASAAAEGFLGAAAAADEVDELLCGFFAVVGLEPSSSSSSRGMLFSHFLATSFGLFSYFVPFFSSFFWGGGNDP